MRINIVGRKLLGIRRNGPVLLMGYDLVQTISPIWTIGFLLCNLENTFPFKNSKESSCEGNQ